MSKGQAQREKFEAWCVQRWRGDRGALGRNSVDSKDADQYTAGPIEFAWQAWLASASLSTPPPPAAGEAYDLLGMICDYFELGVAEGKEGRTHDTEEGAAQALWSKIERSVHALGATPQPTQAATVDTAPPDRDPSKPAEQQGVFRKFDVRRTDGSSAPGGKHHGCEYLVLDVTHDPHTKAALDAYVKACALTHPVLAADMIVRYALPCGPLFQPDPPLREGEVAVTPIAWIRFCSDGCYEGPLAHARMEEVRKRSGAWTPLYTRDQLAFAEVRDAVRYRFIRNPETDGGMLAALHSDHVLDHAIDSAVAAGSPA